MSLLYHHTVVLFVVVTVLVAPLLGNAEDKKSFSSPSAAASTASSVAPISDKSAKSVSSSAATNTTRATTKTLSNIMLPRDREGRPLITGEMDVMSHNGSWYFYANDWGSCPGIDCCASSGGCASCCYDNPPQPYTPGCGDLKNGSDPYGYYHQVVVYQTSDFVTWNYLGVALPLSLRKPGELMRMHVIYNAKTQLFVMWYEDRPETGYSVAISPTPQGPFHTIRTNVVMPGSGRIADMDLFVDPDTLRAYHVRVGFVVVELDENYTSPLALRSTFKTPRSAEAPVMFKRGDWYYILSGTDCCYCRGGANVFVVMSKSPNGPWIFAGDVGSNTSQPVYNPHSPYNYITKSQLQKVFVVPKNSLTSVTTTISTATAAAAAAAIGKSGDEKQNDKKKEEEKVIVEEDNNTYIFLGMQWNSGLRFTPPTSRNHDLMYFWPLQFNNNATIKQIQWADSISFLFSK